MALLSSHSTTSDDALMRPAFPLRDKLRRLAWSVVYHLLFRPSPTPCHGYRCALLRWFGASLGRNNYIYPTARIWAPWNLTTGDVVTLGPSCEVYNPATITLGHHTIISQQAYLCGATHDYNSRDFTYTAKPIVTQPYAWVCARAIVLPGVTLGEGSVLGAGSVSSRDLYAWTVYAGNPAVEVKQREKSIAEA